MSHEVRVRARRRRAIAEAILIAGDEASETPATPQVTQVTDIPDKACGHFKLIFRCSDAQISVAFRGSAGRRAGGCSPSDRVTLR
jgi:hypothetical protein